MYATYSPEDDKLRLYPNERLDEETYKTVKDAGFRWAPKQELFYGVWSPTKETLLLSLCGGSIEDDDKSLAERAETRSGRFEEYSDKRKNEAESVKEAVKALADGIPLGQPILIGHHSQKRAEKNAQKITNGMRRAVNLWETSQYWQDRAQSAIGHADYLQRPDVRARRIKKLGAGMRKWERSLKEKKTYIELWNSVELTLNGALEIANHDSCSACFPLDKFPRKDGASTYEGSMSFWSALKDEIITPEQARDWSLALKQNAIPYHQKWIEHYQNRIAYETAMLGESGGTIADKTKPEKGGACKCWVSKRFGGWSYIHRVNKISVSVLTTFDHEKFFSRTVAFDKLKGVMTKQEVQDARDAFKIINDDKMGFQLSEIPVKPAPKPAETTETDFDKLKESLKAGVKTVSVPQLFVTPKDIAYRMVDLINVLAGQRVLEPSAGTGALIDAVLSRFTGYDCGSLVAVEVNQALAKQLEERRNKTLYANENNYKIVCADFLQTEDLGKFDRIVMNPPFISGDDVRHIRHAQGMLKPNGKLVSLCAAGPRQQRAFEKDAIYYEVLPTGSFKQQGTNVNVALVVLGA